MIQIAQSRRRSRRAGLGTETPIIDRKGRIVGWTNDTPLVERGRVRHPIAESLVGGPVTCAYVQITGRDATRAGAPPDWSDPWRCLAFVPDATPESRATA